MSLIELINSTFIRVKQPSDFVFIEDHVGNSVNDWVFSLTVHTNQFAFHDVSLK